MLSDSHVPKWAPRYFSELLTGDQLTSNISWFSYVALSEDLNSSLSIFHLILPPLFEEGFISLSFLVCIAREFHFLIYLKQSSRLSICHCKHSKLDCIVSQHLITLSGAWRLNQVILSVWSFDWLHYHKYFQMIPCL